jgi:hypothetical protein
MVDIILRNYNKTFFQNIQALTPSPSPKGRGEVFLEPHI